MSAADDILAVQKTVYEYCRLYDDGKLDALVDLFTEDAALTVSMLADPSSGRAGIRAFFANLIHPDLKGIHCAFNPVVHVDGDTATADADYIWVGPSGGSIAIGSAGRYCHTMRREPDRWRIAALRIELLVDPTNVGGG